MFLSTQTAYASYNQVVIIYLRISKLIRPSIRSIPFGECPYHNLGFSLVGFTSFHLASFQASFVTVALSGSVYHIKRLRYSFRRQSFLCLPLFFQVARTLRSSQSRVSMDFPLQHKCCSDYSNFMMYYYYT